MAADKLFVNGAVFDGRRHRPGLSVAPDLSDVAGPRTEVVDVAGGLLLRGSSTPTSHMSR